MKHSLTRTWIGSKLGVDSGELKLFIEDDSKTYLNRSREVRRKLADQVEYTHPNLGLIFFGPKNIFVDEKKFRGCGYESKSFKKYVSRNADN